MTVHSNRQEVKAAAPSTVVDQSHSAKLIPRIHEPANLEFSFSELRGAATPNQHFFVRNHFPEPAISQDKWRLQVEGAVEKTLTLSLKELEAMPSVTHTSVLECAGNGRLFLPNVPEGVQWGLGGVGCARWTGVPLRDVLERAGVQTSAIEVVLQGADHGTPEKHLKPKSEIHFSRSLPLTTAQRPDVLLAYKMNSLPLPAAHGAAVEAHRSGVVQRGRCKVAYSNHGSECAFSRLFPDRGICLLERRW